MDISNQLASIEAEGYVFTDEEIQLLNEMIEADISWDDKIKYIINKTKERFDDH